MGGTRTCKASMIMKGASTSNSEKRERGQEGTHCQKTMTKDGAEKDKEQNQKKRKG